MKPAHAMAMHPRMDISGLRRGRLGDTSDRRAWHHGATPTRSRIGTSIASDYEREQSRAAGRPVDPQKQRSHRVGPGGDRLERPAAVMDTSEWWGYIAGDSR